jgi:hypothetical protein
LADAAEVAREALDVAVAAGLGAYPFAIAIIGVYIHQSRISELPALAKWTAFQPT